MDLTVATALPFRPQIISVLSSTGQILRFASMIDHPSHVPTSREQQLWFLARNANEVQAAFSRCHLDGVTTELTVESVTGRPFRTAFIRSHGAAVVIAISELEDQAESEEVACELSSQLTARQLEICKLQSEGVNTKEIGRRLEISESAVNSHRNAAMVTLHCATREQLGAMLARAGLV
jgi:DNA-binding CsgD family transcriptional regulator